MGLQGEPSDVKLRVEGDTPMLLAGFKAANVGRGALCMTWHESRWDTGNCSTNFTIHGSL